MTTTASIGISVSDVSKQKVRQLDCVSPDSTVGELVQSLLDDLRLPKNDPEGRPLSYHALLDRESRHVHASELVADALQTGDRLTIQPIIEAG